MQTNPSHHTQVLIVGGSLVGLSAALFLASRGVDTIVVEKHRGSSSHPRAVGFTELTLEHFRAVGIEDRVPQAPAAFRLRRIKVESLAGTWAEETPWTPGQAETDKGIASPCTGAAIAQDLLEPILRTAATERGADLRQGVEMLNFVQSPEGVTARVRHRDTGEEVEITADYLIAADGADSPVREKLGIARSGVGHLRTIRSALFRCDEAEQFLATGVTQFEIEQPGVQAFLTHYPDGRWVLMFSDDAERTEGELRDAIRRALGRDMALEVITTGRWEMAGRIADRYSVGRVFLAGDAAHQLPPTRGGFGANTGIDDAYNLAWKLQMVLSGEASPALLDTYSAERQPIGWLRHQQTFARPDYRRWAGDAMAGEPLYSAEAMELGQRVSSAAIIASDQGLPPAASPGEWAGQPGTRVPHAWIEWKGARYSTIDLFTERLTLISAEPRWIEAARQACYETILPLKTVHVGVEAHFPADGNFAATFGVGAQGACLVRPDAIVAWRSHGLDADPTETLGRILDHITRRIGSAEVADAGVGYHGYSRRIAG
ncbi:FAD-dependent monooxygenase [Sphingomonas sp. BK580]|uniref:FAD-dependent monooxygenase n=1 Tax=Sphingomonas sp. BK580 TaxID=2586972 RepID=UPI0016123E1B|nr:FAD-dependent monooxygenase [Sphingomonas sp. BK580]MBB3695631.1 2-polyprenyl-6-methoxyphenol hydroxylase-like FAD-dependent oxidoreductase [Sphingomonas sp. BK580]